MNRNVIGVAVAVDRVVLESRLRDLAFVATIDRADRVAALVAVLSQLRHGAYLIGCGPYCCGILPLTVDEVILGRPPTPLEHIPDCVADFTLNDAVWLLPREVSRIHASIIRRNQDGVAHYWVQDKQSRTGTYVNDQRVEGGNAGSDMTAGVKLSNGDLVSLGPSGVNSYVFLEVQ